MAASPIGTFHIDQLLRTPFVAFVRSRVKATGAVFQNYYNLGGDSNGTMPPLPPGHDMAFWHYFDSTRTIGTVRPSIAGPSRPVPKSAGIASGALIRYYEAMTFEYNRIAGYQALGKPIGFLTSSGQDWVARQMSFLLQRHQNLMEFAISRMFRGGFDIKTSGNGNIHSLVEYGSGQMSVNYQIPATHKTKIALNTSGTDVIDATWSAAGTDLINQHAILRQVSERESGFTLKDVWITSRNYVNLVNNTGLRNAGGSAFRVWEDFQTQNMSTLNGMRERGQDVHFRALPGWTFHVYDGVLNVDQDRDSLDEADNSLFIPNTQAIYTPAPSSEWIGKISGQETVIEQYGGQPKTITGLHNFKRRVLDPVPAEELHIQDKFLPILEVPRAVYYPLVVF